MLTIGTKMYVMIKGKRVPCSVTDSWDGNEYHRAGFRVDIHFPNYISNVEYKEDDIGNGIFLAKK